MSSETRKSTEGEEKQALGNCYKDAADFLRDYKGEEKVILVHGDLIPRHGKLKDAKISHAWVEFTDKVFDPANPEKLLDKDIFYWCFRIVKDSVRKYTFLETVKSLLSSKHYGPWD